MKSKKIAYLCDGTACDKMCVNKTPEEWAAFSCHHTVHEEHARNKVRRKRKFKTHKGGLVEVE